MSACSHEVVPYQLGDPRGSQQSNASNGYRNDAAACVDDSIYHFASQNCPSGMQ